ncbi:MAG: HAD-IIB family hydrolase [Clostridia bacterium]|nr:HAD-IIB family hydrolase [Clostridia bacterium]
MTGLDGTLYLSDLDGTLLTPSAELTGYTVAALNEMIRSGLAFTVATARTAASVRPILAALDLNVPLILMNGAQIYDHGTGRYLHAEYIGTDTVLQLTELLRMHGAAGFMYGLENDTLATYYERLDSEPLEDFMRERQTRYNKRFTQVERFSDYAGCGIQYFVLLDRRERLAPVRDGLAAIPGLGNAFYPDIYREGYWFLEVFSDRVSKGNAARLLRSRFGYARLVGFGDHLNDLPLFDACDEGYAVGNAHPDLAAAATGRIGSNTEDGVARWLEHRFMKNV